MKKISNIGWSIGNFCNARCNHCYSWKQRRKNEDILTKEEIDIILNKLIQYGVKTVNFGGNEPIFTQGANVEKTDLPYIINTLTEHDIVCGITTNGFTAKYLYEHHFDVFMKVNDWDFSLDAPCSELHNRNRGVSNAFEMVIEGLKLCEQHNRQKSIVVAGMKNNFNKEIMSQFLNIARKYNAEFRINILKPTEAIHEELKPSIKQVYEIFNYLFENTDIVCLSESVLASQVGIQTQGCPCGTNSFRIRSKVNGRVPITPCVYLDMDAGDILTQEIDDIVSSDVFKRFNARKEKVPTKCHELKCERIEECRGGCTARTLLMTGEMDNPDPYCPLLNENEICSLGNRKISKELGTDKVRVHENYLCTWIGKSK